MRLVTRLLVRLRLADSSSRLLVAIGRGFLTEVWRLTSDLMLLRSAVPANSWMW